jgi:streptogramin lyase
VSGPRAAFLSDEQLDAELSAYLTARAELGARRARNPDDVALAIGGRLGLVQRRALRSALRLVIVAVLLLLAIIAAALFVGQQRDPYRPNQPLVTVPLEGAPWAVAADANSIWVGAYRDTSIYRLDPRTGDVLERVGTAGYVCGNLELAFDHLWFGHCGIPIVGRLDPVTRKVDRLTGYNTDRMGFGAGSVWLSDGHSAVERIDPVTMATTARTEVGASALVTFGAGSAWVSTTDLGTVQRIDPATNEVAATIEFPGPDQPAPVHLVETGGSIWVVDEGNVALFRIDPETNTATRADVELEPFANGTAFGDHYLAAAADGLWVRTSDTEIVRVDPASASVVERVETGPGGGAFSVTTDAIWVASLEDGEVWGMQRE